jgi:hypothetical protein
MTAPTAVELTALLGALQAAAADWREATYNFAAAESLSILHAADEALRVAAGEYANAYDDMAQAIERLRIAEQATESAAIIASLEREDAFFRTHPRTQATS